MVRSFQSGSQRNGRDSRTGIVALLCGALAGISAVGVELRAQERGEGFSAADLEFFESRIRPLLVEHCQDCHAGSEPSGNLRLDRADGPRKGGDSGPAAVAGEPDSSLLIQAVRYTGIVHMPPDSRLPDESIGLLEEWVRRGMPWTAESHEDAGVPAVDPAAEWERRMAHWAWQTPGESPPPKARTAWATTEIDRFIEARMLDAGLHPAEPADRATLLRRASWVLTGILPDAGELARFVDDPDPDAFAGEVDRLLASPRFGERFARHWLDLVRYAETCGHEYDYPLPYAFQYRDWVIRAFNADLPYDQFVREQIAGDLVQPPRLHPVEGYNESLIGTGFWFLNEATHGPVDVKGDEAGHIDNRLDVMGKTFLALTISCARCHDHKFDAINDEDFYALSGILQSSRRQTGLLDTGGRIEAASQASQSASRAATEQLREAIRALGGLDQELIAERFGRLRTLAQSRPAAPASVRLQGEDFSLPAATSGTVEVQTIAARDGFAWEGDRQLWWRDGKPGEAIELAFETSLTGAVELFANLTVASDYGRVRMELDGQPLGEAVECFERQLGTTGRRSLGSTDLAAGAHVLRVVIDGADPRAIQRHMFGLDWLELVPASLPETAAEWSGAAETLAADWQVPGERIIAAVDSLGPVLASLERLNSWVGPQPTADDSGSHDRAGQWVTASLQKPAAIDSADAMPLIAAGLNHDFQTGDDGWFRTGWAFGPITDGPALSADGHVLPAGIIAGTTVGSAFQGVVRSPTFEITGPTLRVLLRGGKVQLRVIIDGFDLDIYNPLLFDSLSPVVSSRDQWRWETISGDLGNYIGHRAWLEIIDHGEGAADIAAVWTDPDDPPELASTPASLGESGPMSFLPVTDPRAGGAPGAVRIAQATIIDWMLAGPGSVLLSGMPGAPDPAALRAAAEAVRNAGEDVPAPTYVQAMTEGTPEDEYLFIRGNHRNPGSLLPRRSLAALDGKTQVDWSRVHGSGRWALAEELTDPRNPLVARVMVNRIWQHLFGRGLVRTPDNFGIMGSAPDHPELLDWLANQFVADGWSVKRLIRRMMLTAAWQQSCQADPACVAADPDNRMFARAVPRRLDGESIRDSMLAMSGRLDGKMFGPSVPIWLTEFMQGRGRPGSSGPLDGDGRRTIYLEVRRNFLNPFLLAFDTPIPFNTTGLRNESNVPAQSLILMNDPLVIELAGAWARRLVSDCRDPDQRLETAFLAATGSGPTEAQKSGCFELIKSLDAGGADEVAAWTAVCHVLWNSKAFVFVF